MAVTDPMPSGLQLPGRGLERSVGREAGGKERSQNTHWLDVSYYTNVGANIMGIKPLKPKLARESDDLNYETSTLDYEEWEIPMSRYIRSGFATI